MQRKVWQYSSVLAVLAAAGYLVAVPRVGQAVVDPATQGSLTSLDAQGKPSGFCPLKHTDVKASISGFLARVTVSQEFENTSAEKIEAIYTFPLPQNAAVDDMTLIVGSRTVRARIKPREEARAIYEAARAQGHVAGLLDQERPNIFTQAVANIMPLDKVTVTISYVERLNYEDGEYQFVFPMVVGPRYIPGNPTGKQGGGWAPDTDRVPDASRITPPVAPKDTRAGHDISLEVTLDAGVPIDTLRSATHAVDIARVAMNRATIRLKDQATIPNKDFVLRYDVAGRRIEDAVLAHRADRGGFFTLILQPPEKVAVLDVTPKEIVFVLDTSGSMSGFPIEKAKEAMRLAISQLNPQDTFNLITFSGDTHILFPAPVPATADNLRQAQEFLASRRGGGGTEMMRAIRAALDPSDSQTHLRVVCFMTDGYVGNDMEIIAEVERHPNARVFAFGIGSAVNRFLLDNMARAGRGEVEYVGLSDDGSAAARRFHERVRNPVLTDIAVDWGGLPVSDVYPRRVPDLFSAKPVALTGRYTLAASGTIRLSGKIGGRAFSRDVRVDLPASRPENDVLASLWARTRIADVMSQDFAGMQRGLPRSEVREEVTRLGLEFRLMTQFTSFVAVEERIVTEGGQPKRIEVPVEMPEGVSHEGVFGAPGGVAGGTAMAAPMRMSARVSTGGVVGGVLGGIITRDKAAPPPPPAAQIAERVIDSPATNAEIEHREIRAKLHPNLLALIDQKPSAAPVKNGKVEVQVWLKDSSAATLEALKRVGMEITVSGATPNQVRGRIAPEELEALAKLVRVRYVTVP